MKTISRYIMTLALLLTAVTGAWAQSSLGVKELALPATWNGNSSPLTAADLPGFKASTLDKAQAWTGAPATGGAILIYAFDGNEACFVQFSNGVPSEGRQYSWSKGFIFGLKSQMKFYYTTELTEWPLTPDANKKVWTLAKMPANDIELQVEYYAESNLFLSKEALADKASIAVTAGETTVEFDDDGKSKTTVTEGTAMTVKYNGPRKVMGVKAEKKAAGPPEYYDKLTVTVRTQGEWSCASGPQATFIGQTITEEQAIALAKYQASKSGNNTVVFYKKESWQMYYAKSDGTTSYGDVGTSMGLDGYDVYYVAQ